jgi:hypothetical protein
MGQTIEQYLPDRRLPDRILFMELELGTRCQYGIGRMGAK